MDSIWADTLNLQEVTRALSKPIRICRRLPTIAALGKCTPEKAFYRIKSLSYARKDLYSESASHGVPTIKAWQEQAISLGNLITCILYSR
jgi:hypothetical protein